LGKGGPAGEGAAGGFRHPRHHPARIPYTARMAAPLARGHSEAMHHQNAAAVK